MRRAVGVLLIGMLAGCGTQAGSAGPPTDEQAARARAAGFEVDLVYVTAVGDYTRAVAGGAGVYGDAGFQDVYVSPTTGKDLRLTVERRGLTAADCPALPIPAAGAGPVRCRPDGDGWHRTAADREEYAVVRGELLIRASGPLLYGLLVEAATDARPANRDELDDLLPQVPSGPPVERGDIHGDNAPDNPTSGPGG